jgi:hypothetical protein
MRSAAIITVGALLCVPAFMSVTVFAQDAAQDAQAERRAAERAAAQKLWKAEGAANKNLRDREEHRRLSAIRGSRIHFQELNALLEKTEGWETAAGQERWDIKKRVEQSPEGQRVLQRRLQADENFKAFLCENDAEYRKAMDEYLKLCGGERPKRVEAKQEEKTILDLSLDLYGPSVIRKAAVETLAARGAQAIPVLLREEFFMQGRPGYGLPKNPLPLRVAIADTLVRIGEPAVPEAVKMLSVSEVQYPKGWHLWGKEILRRMSSDPRLVNAIGEALAQASRDPSFGVAHLEVLGFLPPQAEREALRKIGPKVIGLAVEATAKAPCDDMMMALGIPSPQALKLYQRLKQMDETFGGDEVVSALEKAMDEYARDEKAWKQWMMLADALAMLGPKAVPALLKLLDRDLDQKRSMLVFDKVGDAAGAEHVAKALKAGPDSWHAGWPLYYSAALAVKPDPELVPPLIDQLAKDRHCMANYIAMVLDRMAPASIPPVVGMLKGKDSDWYARWAAAKTLELMGPKAESALPALEAALADGSEDVDVRIAAARALGRIKGVDPFPLYEQIPDVRERIADTTHEKALAWREDYAREEGAKPMPEGSWEMWTWLVNALSGGENIEAANAWLREFGMADREHIGSFMGVNLMRLFMLCHSGSDSPYAGRLTPENEADVKEYLFQRCYGWMGYPGQGARMCAKTLNSDRLRWIKRLNHNIPMNKTTRDYLALSVLKDDPKYKDRKFEEGDTVAERYEAWNEFFKAFLKYWALNGFWVEHASSNYEYHTYPAYFNLADLAPDPVVRQRAKMFLDLALVEAEQMTISNQRGGTKSRAKQGGLGSNFNPYRGLLYGERGSVLFHAQLPASRYQPPPVAVLLHKLGPPQRTYEIANGVFEGDNEGTHAVNYTWCTPEYITSIGMFDPNINFGFPIQARWTGVIFRDLSAISMDAYTGEKWGVQHKDVMISQRWCDRGYQGWPKINFESGFEKMERDGWIFADNGEAFAAVKVLGSYFWADPIKRTLYLEDELSPIVIQTGMKKDYGSFAAFQKAILEAPLTFKDGKVEYKGPNSAKLELVCAGPQHQQDDVNIPLPKINGKAVEFDTGYRYHSPYMESKAGSDVVTVRYGDKRWDYDFAKNTVREVSQ